MNPFAFSASPVEWLTVLLLWVAAVYLPVRIRHAKPEIDVGERIRMVGPRPEGFAVGGGAPLLRRHAREASARGRDNARTSNDAGEGLAPSLA